ncbi:MAG TPA: ATP-binding protein [Micromonosporaceae bacterium]|nr:ATP-binding protein [Micromonosporaceae bacterium]
MGALGVAVATDFATGIVDLTVRGVLDMSTAPAVRGAVIKAAAEQPSTIVVDLNDTVITDKRVATIFVGLADQLTPSTIGLTVHVRPGDTADLLRPILDGCVPIRGDRSGAIAALDDAGQRHRRLHIHLAPVPAAAAQARALVDLACANWGLDVDQHIARLVVSELVTNAIEHARTDLDVTVVYTGAHLIIQVRDRSTAMPVMTAEGFGTDRSRGLGLLLVDAAVAGWGFHATETGKTVWATLRPGR